MTPSSPHPFSFSLVPPFFPVFTIDRTRRMYQWSLWCFLAACDWPAVACGMYEGILGFVIVFSLFLNKNVFVLCLLLVLIYEVKFYSFSKAVLFPRILKNNGIGFQLVFCFLIVHFLRANHKSMTNELFVHKE